MKKYTILFVCLIAIFIAGCSDDRSYTIDDVTIDATIHDDGSISVRELFTYTFSGAYNGTTRSIHSHEQDFKAYEANDTTKVTDSTDTLNSLETKYDDDMYKTYITSEDETRHVLYTYNVNGSVKKYNDIGTILYTFFDKSNESDLHNVSITIHPPSGNLTDDTYAFLHDEHVENLQTTRDGVHYETDLLEKGKEAPIRLIFTSEDLPEQTVTDATDMKETLLNEEAELAKRYANLDENMNTIKPFIWWAFPILIILFFVYAYKHPSSLDEDNDPKIAQQRLEANDPLYIKFLSETEAAFKPSVSNESLIAALFSLRRRGIITIEKETTDKGKETFKFTWVASFAKVDVADQHLKNWLFTQTDPKGECFYLEDITQPKDADSKTGNEKAKWFNSGIKTWKEHVSAREDYHNLKIQFRLFPPFSALLIIITYTLFFSFLQIDVLSDTLRGVLPYILGSVALISLIFIWQRVLSGLFHLLTFITLLIWFTKTSAVIAGIILIGLILLMTFVIPPHYFRKHVRETKAAIKQAEKMFENGTYPVSEDPVINEKRLEYAILLNKGTAYSNQLEKADLRADLHKYPLLMNPTFAVTTLSPKTVAFSTYTSSGGSGGSSGSSGGGGGAGAF